MKWLIVPVLWVLAIAVALGVLWRLWRGKPIVLHGRWTPRFVRMVAVVLVFLGIGPGKSDAAPVKPGDGKKVKVDDPLPPHITHDAVMKWLDLQGRANEWMKLKQVFLLIAQKADKPEPGHLESALHFAKGAPERLRELLQQDLKALAQGKPEPAVSPRDLTLALEEAERAGFLDPWLCSYLWRKTASPAAAKDRKELIDLMARLHRHARLSNALIAARARVRPLMLQPQAWGTKAGRPRWVPQQQAAMQQMQLGRGFDLISPLKSLYPTTDAGTWDGEALTIFGFAPGSASATTIRAGKAGVPQASGMVRFGRLDLLETTKGDKPVLLTHRVLGTLELPAGKVISVWELPQYVSAEGKQRIKNSIADALAGKEAAARAVEQHLPLTAPFLREALRESPQAKGAPQLRLILTQFDDVPAAPPSLTPQEMLEQRKDAERGLPLRRGR